MERKARLTFYPHPITAHWTHTRLNNNKRALLLCWGGATFHSLCITWMSVKNQPKKGVITGVLAVFLRGGGRIQSNWTVTHYCAFAEHGAVHGHELGGCRRLYFALLLSHHPHFPKVEWKHKELMQGDWTSSLSRLNRCAVPGGVVKRPSGRHNQAVYLLLGRFHKALCSLIRSLQTSQWDMDFLAPILQLSQFSCLMGLMAAIPLHSFCCAKS